MVFSFFYKRPIIINKSLPVPRFLCSNIINLVFASIHAAFSRELGSLFRILFPPLCSLKNKKLKGVWLGSVFSVLSVVKKGWGREH